MHGRKTQGRTLVPQASDMIVAAMTEISRTRSGSVLRAIMAMLSPLSLLSRHEKNVKL